MRAADQVRSFAPGFLPLCQPVGGSYTSGTMHVVRFASGPSGLETAHFLRTERRANPAQRSVSGFGSNLLGSGTSVYA